MKFSLQNLLRALLRRSFYKGQDRIFAYVFGKDLLNKGVCLAKPLAGNFKINCDTKTWIGARIYYLGDYEAPLKKIFKQSINKGGTVLDVGANIGFHTLYFAELAGQDGKVISFEPIPYNYAALEANVALNHFDNIALKNIALSDTNETFKIHADPQSTNPGGFNLFDAGGTTEVTCRIGDEIVDELNLTNIDLIKIDVEGYERYVINGLSRSITKFKPKVIFEYAKDIQLKAGEDHGQIFDLLKSLNYTFFLVTQHGLSLYDAEKHERTGNILATPQ